MGRDPEKTAEIRTHCRPELKARWESFVTLHAEGNPDALESLLDMAEENPELLGGYFD